MNSLQQLLSFARAGNLTRAWALCRSSGWAAREDDPKALTLKGRLLKDRARASDGAERTRLYRLAAETYSAAAALELDSYPLINAAALSLLGGKPERAHMLAQETLAWLDEESGKGENAYWRAATRAEALLLLGDEAGACAALADGIAELPRAWEDHAATLGQFELILAEQGKDVAWLDRYRPPPSLYFSGLIGLDETDETTLQEISAIIAREKPGFGYGALAAGADILIAEALHSAGAELHIILPYPVDRFRELSVAPFGKHWITRFNKLIKAAATLDVLTELPDEEERTLAVAVELADLVAIGQCVRNAEMLKSRPKALTIFGIGDQPRHKHFLGADSWHQEFSISVDRISGDHSVTESSEEETREIAALLWIDDFRGNVPEQLSQSAHMFQSAGDARYLISTDVAEPLAMARMLLQHDSDSQISLLIDIMDPKKPTASLLEQARDVARASSGGLILTDYKSAMILTLEPGSHRVEEIGELQAAHGTLALWSLA
mgnify:CR=1 FL=1